MTLFEANKNNLIVRYTELFTSGSAKVYYAEFSFSADWNGFAKVATFRNGSVSKSVAVDETNIFGIPWEVFATPGTLECGITGTKEDGTTLPTIWATVAPIKQGAEIGDEAKEVTPDIYEQLISRLDEGVTQAQNAAERAEAAAINQPYPNQVTGTWWVWNPEAGEYVDSGISSAAYTLPSMTGTALGGAMADPAQASDTQPVRIGADHKLYTAPGGSASSPDVLCVNLTMGEGNTITADKTFAEITEAAGSGMCVIARFSSGETLYLSFYDDTFVNFLLSNGLESFYAHCNSSDQWGHDSYTLTASDVGAIPSPSTAAVGQTIIVKAVDGNGVPTEWEAADMPSGGGGEPTIIFDSGKITEEVNLIGPIDISKYSRLRIFGKAYPSANSAGKRAAQLYFDNNSHRLLCNAGNGKLFDTAGNPVSFLIYLDVGANALSAFSFSGYNASNTFDDVAHAVSSTAAFSDGGCLVYSTKYDLTKMYLTAQDDLSTRPWGVGTRIMVIGDD